MRANIAIIAGGQTRHVPESFLAPPVPYHTHPPTIKLSLNQPPM